MENNVHIFELESTYVLYDRKTLDVYKLPEELGKKLIDTDINLINEYVDDIKKGNEIPHKASSSNLGDKCDRLVLMMSNRCNLSCKYCYEKAENPREHKSNFMSKEVLEASLKFVIDKYPKGIEYIQFFGGEPLLDKKALENACKYIHEFFNDRRLEIPSFTIVTNGTLIDQELIELFNKYFVSVTISLDGTKRFNDSNRVFKNSSDSVHDTVIKNINAMNENRKFKIYIQMTVDSNHIKSFKENSYEALDYILSLNVDSVHVSPVIDVSDKEVSITNCDIEDVKKYFEVCTKKALLGKNKKIKIYKVNAIVSALINKNISTHYCSAGISDLTVDTNGDVYPCFMFGGDKRYVMANVLNNSQTNYENIRQELLKNEPATNEECSGCWARDICTVSCSGCIGAFYIANNDIKKPIKYNCEIGKKLIERVLYEIVSQYG